MKRLSVAIPIHNQSASLDLTLYWFTQLFQESTDFELVVVNDGSTEDLSQIIKLYEQELDLVYLKISQAGRATARNTGVEAASGQRILFNDGDRFPAKSSLEPHLTGKGVLVGNIQEFYFFNLNRHFTKLKHDFSAMKSRAPSVLYHQLVTNCIYDENGALVSNMPWISFLTGNVSLPKSAFLEVGGFDSAFIDWGVEHFELGYRLWQNKLPFSLGLENTNYHLAHSCETEFYKKALEKSLAYFINKHQDPILPAFADFLFGQKPLQELEPLTKPLVLASEKLWTTRQEKPVVLFLISSVNV